MEIKMCGVYPDGPSSGHSFATFSCGNGPGNDRYTRVPSAKPHTFCMPTPGVSGACPCVARLNPTHFAFRPLRATERSGSGRPRSTWRPMHTGRSWSSANQAIRKSRTNRQRVPKATSAQHSTVDAAAPRHAKAQRNDLKNEATSN